MNEVIIRIQESGTIAVEEYKDGVKSYKDINPDSLLACINKSLLRGSISSGLLPKGCLSFSARDDGGRDAYILHPEIAADISYFGTAYAGFPLPRLVFGFHISQEGRVSSCRIGIIANDTILKPDTKMYRYPLSNVSGFALCTGNNTFPKCTSLHTLGSLPYHILAMPNNNDHFCPQNNKGQLEMRDLLEHLKDKPPEYYYSDVLIPCKSTLGDFINGRDMIR